MERLQKNVLYEICKYVDFVDMKRLRGASKTLKEKLRDALIILAEREANRLLLSSDNLNRNLFVSKQKPQETLNNEPWYDFLMRQLKMRASIKHRLYHVVPGLFPDIEKSTRIKLTTFMFSEIKRKRKMDISMKKIDKHSGVAFTAFQDLVYVHSTGKLSDKYPRLIETPEPKWSEIEVVDNDEVELFKRFRVYQNTDETCPKEPKTPVLAYLYLIDKFCQSHCQTVANSIASKCSNETFLDEYNARWQSYVSLIQIFETELHFLPTIMNDLSQESKIG